MRGATSNDRPYRDTQRNRATLQLTVRCNGADRQWGRTHPCKRGDGDYVPLVEEVKRLGKIVVCVFFDVGNGLSPALKIACDEFRSTAATNTPPSNPAWRRLGEVQAFLSSAASFTPNS